MSHLSVEYTNLKNKAKGKVMNIEPFALSIPCFKKLFTAEIKKKKINKIIKKKGASNLALNGFVLALNSLAAMP